LLDDEIAQIVDMGVDLKLNHPVSSMTELLGKGGFGRRVRRRRRAERQGAETPGARGRRGQNIHIGITWLESVAFEHIKSIGEKVLIIGVGTPRWTAAAPPCASAQKTLKVMARKPRQFFKAPRGSWEDAEEEHVKIIINRSPGIS